MDYFQEITAVYINLLIFITFFHHGLTQQLLDMRLAGGPTRYSGRVEVLSENGEWGTVCDDNWGFEDALVVCRQLGFGPALDAPREAAFGEGSGPIYLDEVECIGNEESLFDCRRDRRRTDCGHHEDASVVCVSPEPTIRLVGGQDSSEGRVEISLNGQWGTVCHDDWDINDATVVCKQLGFDSARRAQRRAAFGEGTGPVWLTNVGCTGNEVDILDCTHDRQNNCAHREDASVTCTGKVTIDDIRLSDEETILEGRVEVMIDGQWGTVCDDFWSIEDGHVVCRELGYLAATEITQTPHFGEGEGEILLNNFHCKGYEASLADCRRNDGVGGHRCFHHEDAGVRCLTEATYSDVRLTGGTVPWEGRVELFLNGQWGTICDDSWDINAANVICKERGYPAAESNSVAAKFGEGSGPIWFDGFSCRGNEMSLASCSHNGIGVHECGHHEDVGVRCEVAETYSDIQLTGGMRRSEGRVEILVGGQWGTICDNSWDFNAADVVCRELGYPAAELASVRVTFGRGPIWLDNVRCDGNESSLAACSHDDIGAHDCGHHQDVGVKCEEILDMRLAEGTTRYSGRVEVLSENGEWGTVCDDNWGFEDALVVCRQLGFGPALAAPRVAYFGAGSGPIYLDEVECIGNEESLFDCRKDRRSDCDHHEDAGVVCVSPEPTIRLVGGQDSSEGRVEISLNGQWGTVCHDDWDINDATVVCKQLGFDSARRAQRRAAFGEGTGPVWMTNVGCTGTEVDILDCTHERQNSCAHREDASVTCTGKVTIDDIRLSDGETILEGRVEVMINGQWGTVCDDSWSIEDGHVVCRELGYLAATEITQTPHFGEGEGEILFNNFRCKGYEASLADCRSDGVGGHNCFHHEDAGVRCLTEATYSDVRLTGGTVPWEGRVELFLNGQWGTICDDSWDINAANVICKERGYPAAESNSVAAKFGEGSGPIWFDGFSCRGNEMSLASCSHNGIGVHECGHHEDVGVRCEVAETYSDIQLTGGMTRSEGRVEILVGGQWGTICDNSWDFNAADVVCRELGYPAAELFSVPVTFGRGPIWLDNVRCDGNESSLAACSHDDIGTHVCGHHQDVGVKCEEISPSSIDGIRLVGGSTDLEGRVEIFVEGEWGTICDDDWDIYDAHVVCRELGFDSALEATIEASFGEGTGPILLDDVQCTGNETTLSNCTIDQLGFHNCEHDDDAGVICLPKRPPTSIEKMRLVGGSSAVEGRVEIRVQGNWGTICDDKWDIDDAIVVCKQLGFASALDAPTNAFFGSGRGPIWLDDVECEGDESTISKCKSDQLGSSNCQHEEDASVVCLTEIGREELALHGGKKPGEGILEVSINGKWEALCNDENWGIENSYVVCRQLGFESAVTPDAGFLSVLKSASTWNHFFQCSGEEGQLDDCSIGQYFRNYTCESQLVAVKCASHETGTEAGVNHTATDIVNNWVYIGAILLLITIIVVTLVIGIAMCQRSRRRAAYPSGSVPNDYVFPFSAQRPLPNAPLSEGLQEYVRMNGKGSCDVNMAEKPDSACGGGDLNESNMYTTSFEQTYHCATNIPEEEDPYATSIFDSNAFGSPGDEYQPIGEKFS